MDCAASRPLLQAYVDRQLEVGLSLELEQHLAHCAACRQHHDRLQGLGEVLRRGLEATAAPLALHRRVQKALDATVARGQPLWKRQRARWALPAAALAAGAIVLALPLMPPFAETQTVRIVYHINDNTDPATALRNLANQLEISPGIQAVVVAHNRGVDFLLTGARDPASGELLERQIAAVASRGVEFRVCGNTLARRQIDPGRVLPVARIVPSGIAEIARLQTREHFAYMRL